MNHVDVKHHLADYLEGDLDLDARALVDAHLDACVDCANEVDEMQRTIRLLRMLPEPETPPMIAANVMRRIRAGETRPTLFGRIGRALGGVLEPSFVLPASAVAAAAFVVVVVQDPSTLSRMGVGPAPHAEESSIAGADSILGLSEPRGNGMRAEVTPRFGAPAAQDFRITAPPQDRSLASTGWLGSTPNRVRIELAPMAPRQPGLLFDPMRAPRISDDLLVAQPSRGYASGRFGADGWTPASDGFALPVAQPRFIPFGASTDLSESSAGEDKRDEWIARGLEDPAGFARYIASQNLAEQELWVARLTRRAETQGLLEALVAALRDTGDSAAVVIAADFEAESARLQNEAGGRAEADVFSR